MASVQGSTGVDQDRGMCEEKRKDDRPAEGGTLNSGRLAPPPVEEIYLQRANDFQPKEGVAKSHQESDLPIVVRDGNTDHTAKDQAGMQRGQSTHARGTNILNESVSRTLSALGTKAGKEPGHRFRGLARLLDRQMLGEAFRRLKRKAAPGIDGVTMHGMPSAWFSSGSTAAASGEATHGPRLRKHGGGGKSHRLRSSRNRGHMLDKPSPARHNTINQPLVANHDRNSTCAHS